jgi:hypothetical protein
MTLPTSGARPPERADQACHGTRIDTDCNLDHGTRIQTRSHHADRADPRPVIRSDPRRSASRDLK